VPYNGTDGAGCFGDVGPGRLGFADGLWSFRFDTGYLEPLVEYDIQFAVWKDQISASAEVSLYVEQPPAPNVSIRSVDTVLHASRDRARCQSISIDVPVSGVVG